MINSTEKKYYTLYKMFDKVSSKVGSTIGSNKKVIQMILTVLLLLQFAPYEVLGSEVNKKLQSVMNPITNLMSNVYMRTLVFIVLLWSCCVIKDMNTFFLVAIYFIVSK